jgi:hypothetical protein
MRWVWQGVGLTVYAWIVCAISTATDDNPYAVSAGLFLTALMIFAGVAAGRRRPNGSEGEP